MGQYIDQAFGHVPDGDFWVFGYGSLMWNPGFAFVDKQAATLQGFKRSLCVWSWHHRGTQSSPGLVFGLDKVEEREVCCGCAYLVSDEYRQETLAYLKERELITDVYQAAILPISIAGRREQALTFIVDPSSKQYAGQLAATECAGIIYGAQGISGANTEYVLETWHYLQQQKISDEHLEEVSRLLE